MPCAQKGRKRYKMHTQGECYSLLVDDDASEKLKNFSGEMTGGFTQKWGKYLLVYASGIYMHYDQRHWTE